MRKFRGVFGFFILAGMVCLCAVAAAAPPTWTISGRVATADGTGVEGVDVVPDGGIAPTVTAADGSYSITVPNHWDGSVTVSKTGWLITPASNSYTSVSSEIAGENYTAYQPKISGYVRKSDGTPLAGAVVTANSGGSSNTTDASGYYEVYVSYNWGGAVSATLAGYRFTDKSYSNITTDQANQDFAGFQPTISGSTNVAGATVTISGVTVITSTPNYMVTVPYGWSGTITTELAGYDFTNSPLSFTNVTMDLMNQNFTPFQPTISGSTSIAGATVTVSGVGSVVSTPEYSVTVPYGWSGTIEASLAGYYFAESPRSYSNVTANQINQNFTGLPTYSGGDGSAINPYQIADKTDFVRLSKTPSHWSKSFILTTDIDLTGQYYSQAPIAVDMSYDSGFQGTQFTGSFDGNGHVISNLYIGPSTKDFKGLWGYIGAGGQIKNLGIVNANIVGSSYYVGGLAGLNDHGTIISCYVTGTVNGHADYVGGLVGNNYSGEITSCYVTGTVDGSDVVGGLIGRNSGTITSCYMTGTVHGFIYFVGGLIGYNSGTITSCYATGEVDGIDYVGGLVGYNPGAITSCYGTGGVDGTDYVGGLIGYNSGTITSCYATGEVDGTDYVGGLIAYNDCGKVIHCYSTGKPTGLSSVGGLCGSIEIGGSYEDTGNFWDTESSGKTASAMGTGKTTADMKTPSTFTGWDFYEIWAICDGYGYPYLRWEGCTGPCISISNYTFSFEVTSKNSHPDDQTLDVRENCLGLVDWFIDLPSGCDWLYIHPLSNNSDPNITDVTVSIDPKYAEYGLNTCQFAVSDPNALNSPQVVTVMLNVLQPEMTLGQTSFSFTAESMSSPPQPQMLAISNTGYDTLNWTIAGADVIDWLTVLPESGQTVSGDSNDVALLVDPAIAGYGLHNCELTISDPNATSSPQVVAVTLDVLRPEIGVVPASIDFECDVDEPNVLTQVPAISNSGYDTLNWNITEDCDWLSVSPASGQCVSGPNEVTLTVDTAGLEIGYYNCELTITDPNASNSPVMVPVSLHVYRNGERHVPMEYCTIQGAIDAAVDGDHVIIHPGRYTGYGNGKIYFPPKDITVRSVDPSDPIIVASTIIVPFYPRAFTFTGDDYQNCVIDGLTIADASFDFARGYAIAIDCTSINAPLIRNCVFRNLSGSTVVYGYYSSMQFENCQFIDNQLDQSVIMSVASQVPGEYSLALKNCLIAGNVFSLNDIGARCLYVSSVALEMDNCTLAHNLGESEIGYETVFPGILSFNGPLSITDSIIWKNTTLLESDEFRQIAIVSQSELPMPNEPWVSISNSDIQYGKNQLLLFPDTESFWAYTETRQLPDPNLIDPNWIQWGPGNMDADPLFVREPNDGGDGWFPIYNQETGWDYTPLYNNDYGDLHLKSEAGRFVWDGFARADFNLDKRVDLVDFSEMAQVWGAEIYGALYLNHICNLDGDTRIGLGDFVLFCEDYLQPRTFGAWVADDVASPCIDAGDPNDVGWQGELWPHGGRINMGAYGGTAQASMSPNPVGNPADLNYDDVVDIADWSLWADDWLGERVLLDSDFDRNNIVDANDVTVFMENWLWWE